MIHYNLGCNFDMELLNQVVILNEKHKAQDIIIDEFFGSDRQHAYLTARPEFRLPDISKKYFEDFVKLCNHFGISFNYTLNSINPGSKRFLMERKNEIIDFVKYLEDIGVKRVTVSNILMMDLVRKATKTISIEVSTIMHVDTISQIKWLYENFQIDKICGSIAKNRNISFLKKASEVCKERNISYEILVNEFCGIGGGGENPYGTGCILRDHCYILHSSNITKEDAELFETYPMGYCMDARMDPSSWLKMRFVLPQDIDKYSGIGINNFKISGRTGTTKYLLSVAEGYLKKKWNGNLLSLWKPLETIYSEQSEMEFIHRYDISCAELEKLGFVNHWFTTNKRCEEEECGTSCHYCNIIYHEVKKLNG